ncbi:hypothetical protein H0H81_010151 [Sphagnurus paluster]|uniref:Uncharacterized protein n=1 Tax=Sphagnurus paluster TaxID=117069 RepID=A0A9P7K2M5_9AGAR|nr:hypothetical protein H0H81_010151 [Sphagnurus paluster]
MADELQRGLQAPHSKPPPSERVIYVESDAAYVEPVEFVHILDADDTQLDQILAAHKTRAQPGYTALKHKQNPLVLTNHDFNRDKPATFNSKSQHIPTGSGTPQLTSKDKRASSGTPSTPFTSLAQDTAAQRLLASMREGNERVRRAHAPRAPARTASAEEAERWRLRDQVQKLRRANEVFREQRSMVYVPPPPPRDDSDIQHLRQEVDALRRENEIFRSLEGASRV